MAGRILLYGSAGVASSVNPVLLHNQRVPCSSSEPHDSIFMPASSASFLGSRSMVSFEDVNNNGKNKRMEKTYYGAFDQEDNGGGEDDYDDYLRQPEKKRRLTVEQVQFLEKSFELENKLEPERKIELAKELGLQPRQIAIWFQNRRARWKTKQLEKDYDALQTNYDKLKSDYDILLMEKDQLKAEVAQMTEKLHLKEKEKNGETAKDSSSFAAAAAVPDSGSALDGGVDGVLKQQEDLSSSAKSDVLDSDSPRYTDGGDHSSLLEQRGDSSYVFEPDQYSDLSQDDDAEVNISKNNPLRCPADAAAYFFPKMEEAACYSDQPSSSYFGFPVDDQDQDHAFGFWQYN